MKKYLHVENLGNTCICYRYCQEVHLFLIAKMLDRALVIGSTFIMPGAVMNFGNATPVFDAFLRPTTKRLATVQNLLFILVPDIAFYSVKKN